MKKYLIMLEQMLRKKQNTSRFQNPPGPGSSFSFASIFISQFDCTTQLLAADCFPSAPLADSDFQVIGKLDSATLNTTLGCFDGVSFSSFDVDVALEWTGIGNLSRSNSHNHFQSPGFIINEQFNGTFRSAEVSGSVSDGATNFTLDLLGFGSIISAKSGTVIID